jgi:copper chaperone CopZ
VETMFIAPDIECAGCAASIQKALGRQDGVQAVTVDVPAQRVTVAFDDAQTGRPQIAEALTDIGFPPQED